MLIDVRSIGFTLTDAIEAHARARLSSALGSRATWVIKATMRLEDVNSDRGGVDKRCTLVVALRRRGVEVAEATNTDLYAAIDEAARRVRRSVSRTIARRRSVNRHRSQDGSMVVLADPRSEMHQLHS